MLGSALPTAKENLMWTQSLYYSKNPVDGSLSLLKFKLLQKLVVVFAISDERGAGNSWGLEWGLGVGGNTCSPESISERPQFTCFVSGLKIALSKSSCFDPHEVKEKGRINKSTDSQSPALGGCSLVSLPALVSKLWLPSLSDKFLRLLITPVSLHYGSWPWWTKDLLNWAPLGWAKEKMAQGFSWEMMLKCTAWLFFSILGNGLCLPLSGWWPLSSYQSPTISEDIYRLFLHLTIQGINDCILNNWSDLIIRLN